MECWKQRWLAKHTVLDGRRQSFDGTGGQLFGKYFGWRLLTLITLGIFGFWRGVKLEKWLTKHTHFGSCEGETRSEFTGGAFGLFFVNLLTFLVSLLTLGIASFWMFCYKERWLARRRIIDGEKLIFDGRGHQLFGKGVLWALLTLVTVGIFAFWLNVNIKKWLTSHTHIAPPDYVESAESDPSNPYNVCLRYTCIGLSLIGASIIVTVIAMIFTWTMIL